jgi:UPF0176 protein
MNDLLDSQPKQLIHSAFYKFARVVDPKQIAVRLKELTVNTIGSILVADEGINGMVAASSSDLDAVESALTTEFNGIFAGMLFKRTECLTRPFKHMKIKVKREIVPLGVSGVDAIGHQRKALSPQDWRNLIARDDVVVLDNRNSFEFKLGRFENAVDPGVHHFRDFPRYVKANVPNWKAQGKKVAMYCTGGIRCEKTSAWMHDMGVEVYELDGGILNYLKEIPDAQKDWHGECFVFDTRVSLDAQLKQTDTKVEDVYKDEPDGQWRINRAKRHAGEEPN